MHVVINHVSMLFLHTVQFLGSLVPSCPQRSTLLLSCVTQMEDTTGSGLALPDYWMDALRLN